MGFSINSNLGGKYAAFNASWGYRRLSTVMEKLTSGLAINRAADNPAGLVISEQLRSRIASLNKEIENVSANIDKYQATSATVDQLRTQLSELRTFAVGAANDAANSETIQEAFDVAADSIVQSYNTTIKNAEYNGAKTLDGSKGAPADVSQLSGIDLSTPEAANKSIEAIDAAMNELDRVQVDLGATQKDQLESSRASLEITSENLTAAESGIRDADYASLYVDYVVNLMQTKVSMALLAHSRFMGSTILQLLKS